MVGLWPAGGRWPRLPVGATARVIVAADAPVVGPQPTLAAPPVVTPAPLLPPASAPSPVGLVPAALPPPPVGLVPPPPPLVVEPIPTEVAPLKMQLVENPQLIGKAVWDNQQQRLGIVRETLEDRSAHQVSFLLVDVNGQMLVVPYDVVRTVVEKGQPRLILNASFAQLRQAPCIVGGWWQAVNNPQFVQQVVRFYGGLGLASRVAVRLGIQSGATRPTCWRTPGNRCRAWPKISSAPQPSTHRSRSPRSGSPNSQRRAAKRCRPRDRATRPCSRIGLSSGAQPGGQPQNNAQTGQTPLPLATPPSDKGATTPPRDSSTRLR